MSHFHSKYLLKKEIDKLDIKQFNPCVENL